MLRAMTSPSDPHPAAARASAWKERADRTRRRAYAARQREQAALGRSDAAGVRDLAAQIRADAALVRDDGARTRDDAARVRDDAARVRDRAAQARDVATRTRDEAVRRRVLVRMDASEWAEVLELDRLAAAHSFEAMTHDRAAAELDRTAAEKDRDAAEHDRRAASRDREAAEKDREASERDRLASDADRSAAETDRAESETDLSIAENHLDKTNRLATLGRLAAGITHEVNNPLAALMASLSALELDLGEAPPTRESIAPLVADAKLAAARIANVMNDMRAWLHEGADRPAREPIDVAKWIAESVRLAQPSVEQAARVVLDLQPTAPLLGVPSRLGQVLTNLLVNAAQSIVGPREHNEIRITTGGDATHVRIEVKDSGIGIAPDVLPHIFDPFFTTHEGSGGSGLGLAMCERIVNDHGGTLTVVTAPGEGSTFCIELPSGAETALTATSGTKRARVLLIDDDVDLSRSMRRLLARRCVITTAADGREGLALALAPDAAFDLILCDLMMPVMNGLEFYRRLSVAAPALARQVVFISGGATTVETAAFLATLPNVQLQKPFDVAMLFALLDRRLAASAEPPR